MKNVNKFDLKMNLIKMFFLKLILLISSVASLQDECNAPITDKNNKIVNIDTDCSKKSCLLKCCGLDQVIFMEPGSSMICKTIEDIQNEYSNITIDWEKEQIANYSKMPIHQKNINKERSISSKTFYDFTILQSFKLKTIRECYKFFNNKESFILETGKLAKESPHHYDYWKIVRTPDFCVDKVVKINPVTKKVAYQFVKMFKVLDETVTDSKFIFVAISYTISSFFLLLVLIVYSVLHQLRNIQGMLLVAYVATLLVMQTTKAGYLYSVYSKSNDQRADCTLITEIIYFFILASFFWLKIMSFDIWWTFRGSLKHRPIHRRGIRVKFMIYAVYAYSAAAALTIFAVVMDNNVDALPLNVVVPSFKSCTDTKSFIYYLFVPLIILTSINCLLFLMTIYNIHLLGKEIASFDKNTANKNTKNKNTFWLYIRLSLLMGVSWVIEFAQVWTDDNDTPLWLFVVMNLYNVLTGVVIFFLFVFKTNIFVMLAKRFNIENRWTRRLQATTNSERTETSKSGKSYSRSCSKTTESDMEDGAFIESNPNGEGMQMKTHALNGKLTTNM